FNLHLRGMWIANSMGVLLVCGWIYYMRYLNEQVVQKHEATQKVLASMEKVESLGRIVAQASHQLNTPLGTLQLGISELSDQKNPLNVPEQKRWYEDMQHAVHQISSIISKIQTANIETENTSSESIDLESFVSDWITHWASPRHQIISLENKTSKFNIRTSTAENMGHILTVLLDNAAEAITKNEGNIKVRLENAGTSLFLSVIDNGCGMDEKTRSQALEPLFTTKNKGTGLGLYLCHQLATKYGGDVEIITQPKIGTEIKIKLEKKLL
ncbi:MAG: integral membrane sensor signal transduction histidine kinase, partial [uncultured bacterium]